MKWTLIFLMVFSLMANNSAKEKAHNPVIFLENKGIKAGFLPEVGGRLVFLGRPGGENLLKSDSALWRETPEQRIEPSPESEWKAYNGFITWLGPQSQWWTHQDLNAERRDARAPWPPDPYLIYSAYKVVEQTKSSLVLEGPASPLSGVQLTKKYILSESGLEIQVRMTNSSEAPVSWDIWSNARFEGSTLFFVPACENGVLRISGDESGKTEGLDGEIVESAFTFVSEAPGPGKKQRYAKAFLHPEQGKIVALGKGNMLVMTFDYVERDQVHPEQGFVEIYKMVTSGGRGDLLELEHHSAFLTLQPGESHALREHWHIYEYPGGLNLQESINWYNTLNHKDE